jgi:parallel beta-helix repeat protein
MSLPSRSKEQAPPQKKELPKALPPYKPPIPTWAFVIAAIIVLLIIGFAYNSFVKSKPIAPSPTPTIQPTTLPIATITLSPTIIPTQMPTPTDEPIPTVNLEQVRCGNVTKSIALTGDLSTYGICLIVLADDVTIDCVNHKINGNLMKNSTGIYSSYSKTVVKNCRFEDIGIALRFKNSKESSITNSEFANAYAGVFLEGSQSILVADNTFQKNSEVAIYLGSVKSSTIQNNFISDGDNFGIQLVGSDENVIRNNKFSRNTLAIQSTTSNKNKITGNNATANTAGFKFYKSDENEIANNDLSNNKHIALHVLGTGMFNYIKNNTIVGNEYGVNVATTPNFIEDNYVCDNSIEDFECTIIQNATGNSCYFKAATCQFSCKPCKTMTT